MKKIKVAILGSVGIPANYGGFETLVENLTIKKSKNIEYTVFCSGISYDQKFDSYNTAKLVYLPFKANGWQSIFYDTISIIYSLFLGVDVILMLGNSSPIIGLLKPFTNVKFVNNVAGIECLRNKFSFLTRLYVKLMMRINAKFNDKLIGDNKAVCKFYAEHYGRNDIYLIEYGGDNAFRVNLSEEIKLQYMVQDKFYFKVCRIEPENNIHIVIDAFSRFNDINLVIVGNWSKSDYAVNLRNKYRQNRNIILLDPIYNQDVLNQIRSNCYAYIHGHSVGGTNPSLVEAMSLKLPVIAYDVVFNKETTEYKAAYFKNADELYSIVNALKDVNLKLNADDMHEIANRRYMWQLIVNKYESLYKEIIQ